MKLPITKPGRLDSGSADSRAFFIAPAAITSRSALFEVITRGGATPPKISSTNAGLSTSALPSALQPASVLTGEQRTAVEPAVALVC